MVIGIKQLILEGYTYEEINQLILEESFKNNLAALTTAGIMGLSALGGSYGIGKVNENLNKDRITHEVYNKNQMNSTLKDTYKLRKTQNISTDKAIEIAQKKYPQVLKPDSNSFTPEVKAGINKQLEKHKNSGQNLGLALGSLAGLGLSGINLTRRKK